LGIEISHSANLAGQALDFAWDNTIGLALDTIGDLAGDAFAGVASFIFLIAGFLVLATGSLLDIAIEFSIDTDNFKIGAIQSGWTIFRDIANMTFIFMLLYIAIATILQAGSFNTKRILATLIVVALLINFSFFLTGVVIDAANFLALVIYNAIVPIKNILADGTIIREYSLGGKLTEGLQLSSLLDAKSVENIGSLNKVTIYFLGAVVLFIAAFTFLGAALLFIMRTVVLIFLLILSPLAFAAAVLPATKSYFNEWLHKLMGNAFVAPLFLLPIFVVVSIINSGELLKATGVNGDTLIALVAFNEENYDVSATIKIALAYAILLGLIMGSYAIAKKTAGGIANMSVKYSGKLTGMAVGGAAVLGRRFPGRLGRALRDNEYLKGKRKEGGVAGFAARAALRTSDKAARSSFDVRATRAGKAAEGGLQAAGVTGGLGRATGKGGYDKFIEEQSKERTARAKRLYKSDEEKEVFAVQEKRSASKNIWSRVAGTTAARLEAAENISKEVKREKNKKEAPQVRRNINANERKIKSLENELDTTQPIPTREAEITKSLEELRKDNDALRERLEKTQQDEFSQLKEDLTKEIKEGRSEKQNDEKEKTKSE